MFRLVIHRIIGEKENFTDRFRLVHRMIGENYWERFSIKTTRREWRVMCDVDN